MIKNNLIILLMLVMGQLVAQESSELMAHVETTNSTVMLSDTTKSSILYEETAEQELDDSERGLRRKANKMYRRLGYKASADAYQKLAKKGEYDGAMMLRLAKSYRLNGDSENAEFWYSKVINQEPEASTLFHYAQALQSNGKCEDAVRWYKAFNEKVGKKERVNVDFIEDCSELTTFTDHKDVQVENASTLNTGQLDFAPVAYKKGVVFTSTRGLSGVAKNTDKWTEESFSDLFYAERKDDGTYGTAVSLASDLNGRFHDGAATFTGGQNVMYFSRNNRTGKSKSGLRDLKIYEATANDAGQWSEGEELSFNSSEYTSCHPSVSKDGKYIYFASDRPGGFGGMDIYVSHKSGEAWSAPKNLGPTVNTVGNELFPVLNEDGILFFASNGHRGLGGLDVYAVQKQGEDDIWTNRTNLGKPFNSEKDDFGFSQNAEGTKGYITSSREGGKGADDIYEWGSEEPVDFFEDEEEEVVDLGKKGKAQRFVVVDKDTRAKIENAIVTIGLDGEREEPVYYTTDNSGELQHRVPSGKRLAILVEKGGYETHNEAVDTYEILTKSNGVYELEIERRACTEVAGVVMNKDCNKPLERAEVKLFNKCTGETEVFVTNRDGEFETCLKCGCDYEVIGSKENFTEDREKLKTMKRNCDDAKPIGVTLEVSSIAPAPKFIGVPADAKELEVGSVITLENIYYDFDKYKIRRDASTDLDDVVRLMQEHPSMEIELGSHTDSRGTNMYNQELSLNRATAAVNYLVRRGVTPGRIVAKGYGEQELTNGCANGVDCNEEEHQDNRRTEIRITKFDNPNNIRIERK